MSSDLTAAASWTGLGFVPGAVAPLGKWEPGCGVESVRELAARAAAALALAEALARDASSSAPLLLCAEGHLRGQPRPGCVIAAEILVGLGADARHIRCWPAANHTLAELLCLERMGRALDAPGLLIVTSSYHVPRTALLARRLFGRQAGVAVASATGPLVTRALRALEPGRRARLGRAIAQGRCEGRALLRAALSEGLAFISSVAPGLERCVADLVRGPVEPTGGVFVPDAVLRQRPAGHLPRDPGARATGARSGTTSG